MSIALLLDMAVSAHPDRPALGRRADSLSYADLAQQAAGGASFLRDSGAEHVVFIGVNSTSVPVTLFAAALSGLPFVPLNYRLSHENLQRLLERLSAPLVVADRPMGLNAPGRTIVSTQEWLRHCEQTQAHGLTMPSVGDDVPAVILFTSGTTAEPKGVILRHAHLISYVLQTVDFRQSADDDAALVAVPPYHIAGVGTVLTNVYSGRRIVYLPDFTPAKWIELVRQEGVTAATVVPTMLARLVEHLDGSQANTPSLRSLAYGGARMPQPVLEKALRAFPDTGFVNAYGLTETSSTITILGPDDHRATAASDDPAVRARLMSAGRFVPGVEGQVRDDRGAPVPAGELGELWVRGEQVSGEYVDGSSVLDENGWFPTRDRARIDEDGYLFVAGRSDDTIIRGGENIAPEEIEDVLLRHPGLRDAAVLGVPDEEWGQRIVAVVVAKRQRPHPAAIVDWVRDQSRGSRSPDEVIFRDVLPRGDTGKLSRRHLLADLASAVDQYSAATIH